MAILNFSRLRNGAKMNTKNAGTSPDPGIAKAESEKDMETEQDSKEKNTALQYEKNDKLNATNFCIGCEMLSVDGLGSDAERRWCMRRAGKESVYKFEFRHIAAEVKVWQCPRVKDGCAHREIS